MSNLLSFPPSASPKTLAKAQAWLEKRRQETAQFQQRNRDMGQALMGGILGALGELGASALQIGGTRIDLVELPVSKPSVSDRWSKHLAAGGEVFVLEVNCRGGFSDKKKVDPEKRSLDALLDVDLVRQLAPSVTIYGPREESPWPALLPKRGFQLWVTSPQELEPLWANLEAWLKYQWHNDVMAECKFFHRFEDVGYVTLSQVVATDVDLRLARKERANRLLEQANEEGCEDPQAQSDLKRAISGLVSVESHPLAGAAATAAIEALLPVLAFVMDGKKRYQDLVKQDQKAYAHAHEAIKSFSVRWKDRPEKLPSL